jgi:hypothetical protein
MYVLGVNSLNGYGGWLRRNFAMQSHWKKNTKS